MSCAEYSLGPGPDGAEQDSGAATNESREQWWPWGPPCSPRHSAPLALPQPKAAPKSLLNKPTSAFVLSLVLQKSALVFQTTLAALWCFGTLTAEQKLLHPVLNQGVHYTGKMLFCINSLLEPSHVSLQSFSGTETCHVFPHGKNHINNKEKLGAGWHRSQISDSEAFIHSWGKLLLFFQHCVK